MSKSKKEMLIKSGIALYGERWQTELARSLGLSDGRRIRQWLSGDRPIPEGTWEDIEKLLANKRIILNETLVAIKRYIPAQD
jgi:hypothetical protein